MWDLFLVGCEFSEREVPGVGNIVLIEFCRCGTWIKWLKWLMHQWSLLTFQQTLTNKVLLRTHFEFTFIVLIEFSRCGSWIKWPMRQWSLLTFRQTFRNKTQFWIYWAGGPQSDEYCAKLIFPVWQLWHMTLSLLTFQQKIEIMMQLTCYGSTNVSYPDTQRSWIVVESFSNSTTAFPPNINAGVINSSC